MTHFTSKSAFFQKNMPLSQLELRAAKIKQNQHLFFCCFILLASLAIIPVGAVLISKIRSHACLIQDSFVETSLCEKYASDGNNNQIDLGIGTCYDSYANCAYWDHDELFSCVRYHLDSGENAALPLQLQKSVLQRKLCPRFYSRTCFQSTRLLHFSYQPVSRGSDYRHRAWMRRLRREFFILLILRCKSGSDQAYRHNVYSPDHVSPVPEESTYTRNVYNLGNINDPSQHFHPVSV